MPLILKMLKLVLLEILTLSWWRSLSYRNQAIDFLCKSVDLFLYDRDLHHERAKAIKLTNTQKNYLTQTLQHPFLNVLNVCSTKNCDITGCYPMEISLVKLALWKQAVPDLQHAPISSGNCNINADALCITST